MFVNSYFHGSVDKQWQGQVLASVSSQGNYWFVQTFSWVDGSDSTRHVVSIHEMSNWTFYADPVAMRDNADNVRARWSQPAALTGEIHEFFQDMLTIELERMATGEQIFEAWTQWREGRK